ncbi:MAG: aminoglycoside phosphotransferase family protein [Actinomycetota bacterium]
MTIGPDCLRLLLGPAAGDLLAAALGGRASLPGRPRVQDVRYRPGHSVVVSYGARLRSPGRPPWADVLVASTGVDVPEGTCVVAGDEYRVAVWTASSDPFLPGLGAVLDPRGARSVLNDLGAPAGPVRAALRSYRPGRRAVVEAEVEGGAARLFVKVLRPSKVEALQRRHALLSAHVPVPRSLGWAPDLGLVVLDALPGRSLRDVLAGGADELPGPGQVVALLDALPPVPPSWPAPVPAAARAREHAQLIGSVAPGLGQAAHRVADAVEAGEAGEPGDPAGLTEGTTTVHGDLHDAQLMVDGPRLLGTVDIDTVGPGRRTDDLANLVGHLATLAAASPAHQRAHSYGQAVLDVADGLVDPYRLRLATAATVLGLATGPFRVQERGWPAAVAHRVSLAEAWAASARALRPRAEGERDLIAASPPANPRQGS